MTIKSKVNKALEQHFKYYQEQQRVRLEEQRLQAIREVEEREAYREANDAVKYENAIAKKEAARVNYSKFSNSLHNSIMEEALIDIYENSLPKEMYNEGVVNIGVGLIKDFVTEEGGAIALTSKLKYNSLFLSSLCEKVNSCHKKIMNTVCREAEDEFGFDPSLKDSFFEDIKGEDYDELVDAIRLRVSDGIADFMQTNINNKYDIDETISATKDKVDSLSMDTTEEVKEAYELDAKRAISKIRNSKHGILQSIVEAVSRSALKNDDMKAVYTNENGTLDMDKILESAVGIYTFLEMTNTAKLKRYDESSIKAFIEGMY